MAEQKEILESIRDVLSGKDDDILDLTQKVNDDGSITELAPKLTNLTKPKIEPAINSKVPEPELVAALPIEEAHGTDDILSEIDSILNSKPAEKIELDFPLKAEPEPRKFEIAEEFETSDAPLQATEPAPDGHIMPRKDVEIEKIESMTMDDQNITLEDAKNSISELMGKLKKQGKESPASENLTPFRSGVTIEDLVMEMLQPLMKDWLDKNLPKLVNEAVRKEIQKLIPKE